MIRILAATALAIALGACTTAPAGQSAFLAFDATRDSPDCRNGTPGNTLPGFRCTGDYRSH